MATVSDDGDRSCPLCAEEMDLTDQQLKPCKCGYEICVWCWHHIMGMAEKEGSEGRCPACRTVYDKQKIEAASCKRMVAEIGTDKKQKSQKMKNKPTTMDDRKHLSTVRVVQRNLVYIMGLPIHLSDENILERKEYFGQYGKILKVSVSRQAGTTNQQASNNNTFSVYITYAREEEAVRCIQAVHNFVLEGKILRACFGTTKYCYTWLRNMTCSNPDCLYLHDIGSQEDSFTKDEIISAYTRSRVPQIPSNSLQPRAGNVLPPAVDDLYSSGTNTTKNPTQVSINVKSPPIDTSGPRSTGLPAAASWGLRSSSCPSPTSSVGCLQNPLEQKVEVLDNSSSSSTSSTVQNSAWHDDTITNFRIHEARSEDLEPLKHNNVKNQVTKVSDVDRRSSSAWDDDYTASKTADITGGSSNSETSISVSEATEDTILNESRHSAWDDDTVLTTSNVSVDEQIVNNRQDECSERAVNVSRVHTDPDNVTYYNGDDVSQLSSSYPDELTPIRKTGNGNIESLCLALSSTNLDSSFGIHHVDMGQQQSSAGDNPLDENFVNINSRIQQLFPENGIEHLNSVSGGNPTLISDANISGKFSNRRNQVLVKSSNGIEDPLAHNISSKSCYSTCSPSILTHLTDISRNCEVGDGRFSIDVNSRTRGAEFNRNSESLFFNGHIGGTQRSYVQPERIMEYPNGCYTESSFNNISNTDKSAEMHVEEDSIMSKVFSPDFDPWNNSWSSTNNLAILLAQGNNNNNQDSPTIKQSCSWKPHNSTDQSRFLFARQEAEANRGNSSYGGISLAQFVSPKQVQENYLGDISSINNLEHANLFGSRSSTILSDINAGVMRPKVSTPPGFSVTNRAPPPGFSSPDRYDQAFNADSATQLLGGSLQNQFQVHSISNAGDVEFIDPAILAVGKGRLPLGPGNNTVSEGPPLGLNNALLGPRSSYHPQFSTSESDVRLQLLMQQSISANQDQRLQNLLGNRFLQLDDAYMASRFPVQTPNLSSYSQIPHPQSSRILNNQWNGWNDTQIGNGLSIPEVLMNERFGLKNYIPVNEESKFHRTNSSDLYNRAFGM